MHWSQSWSIIQLHVKYLRTTHTEWNTLFKLGDLNCWCSDNMLINDGTLKKGDKAKVKVNGDGARMSRLTNFILVSFMIRQQGGTILSSKS